MEITNVIYTIALSIFVSGVAYGSVKFTDEDLTVLLELDVMLEMLEHGNPQFNENYSSLDDWLKFVNKIQKQTSYIEGAASFRNSIDITKYNQEFTQAVSLKTEKISTEIKKQGWLFDSTEMSYSKENERKLFLITKGGFSDDPKLQRESTKVSVEMDSIYSVATVCLDDNSPKSLQHLAQRGELPKCLNLEPDLGGILAKSRDEKMLRWAWEQWRNAVGPKLKEIYPLSIQYTNKYATNAGYEDHSRVVLENYEQENFEEVVEELWEDLRPLYLLLHAYVREKLNIQYGEEVVPGNTIPAHLLGNMWAQSWDNIYDIVAPYPDSKITDITQRLNEHNYTPIKMFEAAENFFMSIGLDPMTQEFWNYSMIERPSDPNHKVVCHGSASDLAVGGDVRIKMCTEVNAEDFYTIHHEMGHIEYYLMYRKQPMVFRSGANPGFHEAVGDTIALSVVTPSYLSKIGLMEKDDTSYEQNINYLMKTALKKVAFLPFGLLMDKWRWGVYRGEIPPSEYNTKWWEYRKKYQGIHPPVERSEEDFDPGAKYHIAANVPYIRYFVSYIIQFQFHEALCNLAGHEGELHKCDISESLKAGGRLREMLSMGRSRPWPDALEFLTGSRHIDASSIKRFFNPLYTWLEQELDAKDLGW